MHKDGMLKPEDVDRLLGGGPVPGAKPKAPNNGATGQAENPRLQEYVTTGNVAWKFGKAVLLGAAAGAATVAGAVLGDILVYSFMHPGEAPRISPGGYQAAIGVGVALAGVVTLYVGNAAKTSLSEFRQTFRAYREQDPTRSPQAEMFRGWEKQRDSALRRLGR